MTVKMVKGAIEVLNSESKDDVYMYLGSHK